MRPSEMGELANEVWFLFANGDGDRDPTEDEIAVSINYYKAAYSAIAPLDGFDLALVELHHRVTDLEHLRLIRTLEND